jgi:hypothetical protein
VVNKFGFMNPAGAFKGMCAVLSAFFLRKRAGVSGDDVDPMVLVVGAANAYDRFTTFQGLNPKGALKALLIDKDGAYPLKDLQTLQNILKSQKIV